ISLLIQHCFYRIYCNRLHLICCDHQFSSHSTVGHAKCRAISMFVIGSRADIKWVGNKKRGRTVCDERDCYRVRVWSLIHGKWYGSTTMQLYLTVTCRRVVLYLLNSSKADG